MSQIWFIFAGMLIVVTARSASSTSGSCASIGYSTSCCPPSEGDNCKATDGDIDCYCNPICHLYGDCCEDVYCPADPSTCADFGITQCCNDPNGTGHCGVYDYNFSHNYRCSCNASCHERNDCCPDAQVFCMACTVARKYPDCCNRVNASACYVPGGNCYCDPLCTLYHDCCDDAEAHLSQCGSNRFSRMRLQSFQNNKRLYNRDQKIYQQRGNANRNVYQGAPADRVHMNEREFGSRHRMAGRRGQSSAYVYN